MIMKGVDGVVLVGDGDILAYFCHGYFNFFQFLAAKGFAASSLAHTWWVPNIWLQKPIVAKSLEA